MLFTNSYAHQNIEKMMRQASGFRPRGVGFTVTRSCGYAEMIHVFGSESGESAEKGNIAFSQCVDIEKRIREGAAGFDEAVLETMKNINERAFRRRLLKYLKERGNSAMGFKDDRHTRVFGEAIRKINKNNPALVSAVYLLTADSRLWKQIKNYVCRNEIRFNAFKPRNNTEVGYTLLCCAKDLCTGTKHITVADLADEELIPTQLFGLICAGMAIRRFGLGAVKYENKLNERIKHDKNKSQAI